MKFYAILFLIICFLSCKEKSKDELLTQDKEVLIENLKVIVEEDQSGRNLIKNLKKMTSDSIEIKRKKDSIWEIQESIDKKNISKLIKITKKYGFPNVDRLGKPIPVWLIFQHTPSEYKEDVAQLLEIENKEGRMPAIEYNMIKWHLDGRKGLPFIEGIDIIDNRKEQ